MTHDNCTRIVKQLNPGNVYFVVGDDWLDITVPHENRPENLDDRMRLERVCERVSELMEEL